MLKPSTATGPGETTGKGRAAATHKVRAHATTCITDNYAFHQVPGDVQPFPTVLGSTQDAQMDSITGSARFAIGVVDTAVTQLDTINTGYRQTLSTFSTVVNGITRVCHPNCRRSSFTDDDHA